MTRPAADRHRRRRPRRALLRLLLAAVLAVPFTLLGTGDRAEAAPVLPAGFQLRDMPTGQSELVTDFAWTPDGGYFTTGKNGRVAWVSPAGATRTVALLPVATEQDLGLIGIAVAPDYATSRTVYIARVVTVSGGWRLRAEAWTVGGSVSAPTGLNNVRVMIDLPAGAHTHTITTIVPAADGSLWISIGDSADYRFVDPLALRAQDLNQGYGKLVHMFPDGRGVPGNPFYDAANPTSWRSRVYAYGFRSNFRFSLDPASGAPILGDVGWSSWEEVNLVRSGSNYGWPCWEGNVRTPSFSDLDGCAGVSNTPPLWTYPHGPQGTAVTGGVVYTGTTYPEEYRGAYFFGDYTATRLYTLRFDGTGRLTRAPEPDGFGSGIGGPVKFGTAPNGDVIFADILSGEMRRLVYTPGDRPPVARATSTTNPSTRTVTFDGSGSYDLDGDALTYTWDFGDGTTGTGVQATHQYAPPGTSPITASLTVRDPAGGSDTQTLVVVPANAPPTLNLVTPPAGTLYRVGDTVSLSATASDPTDGPLTVTWTTTLVHCSAPYCHDHPGSSFSGRNYRQPFTDHGDNTRLLITASATDRVGVVASKSFTAMPRLRKLTVASNVPAAVTISGIARTTAEQTVGATVSVVAPTVAAYGVATFERWDDGAPRARQLVMPDSDLTLGLTYLTPMDRRLRDDAAFRTLLGTPLGAETGDLNLTFRDFAGGRAYWTPQSGVHEVHGAIRANYLAGGGHEAFLEPTTDETTAPDGLGRFNDFRNAASSYWTSATGARLVYGEIRAKWLALGGVLGPNGYPLNDESTTGNGAGRYNDFQDGAIYWRSGVGAHSLHGAIWAKYGSLGWERGFLQFPVTSEAGTPDGVGRYNHFQFGSIYWSPSTGAWEVHGAIRDRWAARGWERSYLGYPISDEFSVPGGRRTNFQGGYILWNATTRQVIDRRY